MLREFSGVRTARTHAGGWADPSSWLWTFVRASPFLRRAFISTRICLHFRAGRVINVPAATTCRVRRNVSYEPNSRAARKCGRTQNTQQTYRCEARLSHSPPIDEAYQDSRSEPKQSPRSAGGQQNGQDPQPASAARWSVASGTSQSHRLRSPFGAWLPQRSGKEKDGSPHQEDQAR